MTRGNAHQVKVHYRGKSDDYLIFVENAQIVKDWLKDRSIPLAQVVNGFKIFVTHKQGNQGNFDGASDAQLNSEFGTHKAEEVIAQILEKGTIIETENPGRVASRNLTQGSLVSHN
ncbi:shwachman-Bodian-diamond syndrome protein [Westerdykella ornata]|uniref:Shwachman-Bodian-diamond syndrome protein n=1 Tax=Westerdykella ornata TaxID=318751 RepID=A0A6A6JAV6_WESOR|nr:shwachman-Bodian-diamond syndrome protein [Westerdykella ornata]KAF2273397.1 shwachman-Bodian-diamond syndrome protein [Westerdykella ornata]